MEAKAIQSPARRLQVGLPGKTLENGLEKTLFEARRVGLPNSMVGVRNDLMWAIWVEM